MRIYRPPVFLRRLYPGALFRVSTNRKVLFLTFDDGPCPDSTGTLLKLLSRYNIRATFFCTGSNASQWPELIDEIKSSGHIIGNHGFHHMNGWECGTEKYISDVNSANHLTSESLFRPPFGRISFAQFSNLREKYKIVFWDLMPYDFDKGMDRQKMISILKSKIRPGSIIVLHDNAASITADQLEAFIIYALDSGYSFSNECFR